MSLFAVAVLAAHFSLLFVLCLFGLHRMSMAVRWFKYRKVRPEKNQEFDSLPLITVQVPLFNERFVATRVIDACAALDYPRDKLQIQIVDDSTDDTLGIVQQRVEFHRARGINIEQCRRENREGFKAGALKEASHRASGEFIAIFDADFVPAPSLLRDTIDYFCDPELGMAQFRWGHLNRDNDYFTRSQSIMLDAHFALEQQVRFSSGMLFNFNGTAGIWRASTIDDVGGWSADTLTEDLDLSYRAQLKGWKLIYVNEVECAGEIPADMNAFKSQQHRWAKGGVQVMKKLLPTVWKAPYSLSKKVESTFHLSNNLAYLIVLLDTLLFLLPSIWVRENYDVPAVLWLDIPMMMLASGGHLVYLFFGQVALGHSKLRAFAYLPLLMLLGIQLAFNNARAGLEALQGKTSEFIRTPKSGDVSKAPTRENRINAYQVSLPKSAAIELLLSCVYLFTLIWAAEHGKWHMLPFLLILVLGFASTAFVSFRKQLTPVE